MVGSINLSLAQQFDKTNGRLLSGGKLYFFSAGTTTPQNVYKDQALTLAHPNPITLDTDARIPAFYVADGSVRARLVNKAGVTQFDTDNILVVGPSSGSGGGSSVDPNTIFQTGDVMWLDVSGTRAGWVRDNGRTIGSASSGASERANADCSALFLYLWGTYSDAICPVLTGRGLSAAADWAANKQITLPNKRGLIPGGLDDMGNSAANAYASVPVVSGSVTTAGSVIGETLHTLSIAELATHDHVYGINKLTLGDITRAGSGVLVSDVAASSSGNSTASTVGTGGGGAHNNVPKTVLGTFYRKL